MPSDYLYELPQELIAHEPAQKRDLARLFVYDTTTNTITFDVFKNIARYLPQDALMVLNETKVMPARLYGTTKAGKRTELLVLVNESDTSASEFYALSGSKLKIGDSVALQSHILTILSKVAGKYRVSIDHGSVEELLSRFGTTPTPPYIHTALSEATVRERYQTIFAKNGASVAAPTASLHFTEEVFDSLKDKHIHAIKLRLDVGLGTFAKLTEEQLAKNELHEEPYRIPTETAEALRTAKETGRPLIAVGTTVVRTLESALESILFGQISADLAESTKIFIRPGFSFKMVDHLITNFHVPNSSLMMLVEAFLVHKGSKRHLVDLYKQAIEEKFRFYSFGDSMLIL